MVKIGFAKRDLEETLPKGIPMLERVEAIAMYVEGETEAAVWVVLDFMDFAWNVVDQIQQAVCKKLQMPREHVHILTTHNHGGGEPELEALSFCCAECAERAKTTARPAQMRYVSFDLDRQISIKRRKEVPELGGVMTLWFGASEEENFNAAPFIEHAVNEIQRGKLEYRGREETRRPYDPFAPGDQEVFAIQFQTEDGIPIGTILRFAAHVACSNLKDRYTSDYPWHVRRRMEEIFGGTGLFLTGPCADISPAIKQKADGTEKRMGEYLAEAAAEALQGKEYERIHILRDTTRKIVLPTRKEVYQNDVPLPEICPEELPLRRMYQEKKYLEGLLGFLREKAMEKGEITEEIAISFGALRLNNMVITAFPGETFSETGRAIKECFPEKGLCTVTEHGRTVMYLPPMWDYLRGGYESVCMSTNPGAEAILRERVQEVVADIIK